MADAAQLYAAFRSVCPVDEDGEFLLPLEQLEDGGRGWFAIENAIGTIGAAAPAPSDPYEVDLVPIAPRMADDGLPIQESEDERPSKITIRAFTAADLCVRYYNDDRFMHAVLGKVTGVELDTIEWRMDPSDVEGATALCAEAGGEDATALCYAAYIDGGGRQRLPTMGPQAQLAWEQVAGALLTEIDDDVARVRCRTPGIGVLRIGPLRAGHLRMYQGTAKRETEWMGRLVALAKAAERPVGQLLTLRSEDAVHAWAAFEALKKKADQRVNTPIAARLSVTFSQGDSGKKTSTT